MSYYTCLTKIFFIVFQCITKLGTGLSDENLKKFTIQFNEGNIQSKDNKRPSNIMHKGNKMPDVWFVPEKAPVWEIKAADLSISPIYTAAIGLVDDNKGIALRFPRLIRVRDDKVRYTFYIFFLQLSLY